MIRLNRLNKVAGDLGPDLFGDSGAAPSPQASVAGAITVLRLYIASTAPNSMRAVANLEAICREYLKDAAYQLEVIDVLERPDRARADGVMVTPSLAKLSPGPVARIVGNLNNHGEVLATLGIRAQIL